MKKLYFKIIAFGQNFLSIYVGFLSGLSFFWPEVVYLLLKKRDNTNYTPEISIVSKNIQKKFKIPKIPTFFKKYQKYPFLKRLF